MRKFRPHTHPSLAVIGAVALPLGAFLLGVAWIVYQPPQAAPSVHLISLNQSAVQAKAAIIYDPASGQVLWQKDANEELPLASLTKLMTADVVLGQESPQTPVTITNGDLLQGDAGDIGFVAGETLPLGNLVRFGLTVSSNDAMQAAAASLGPNYVDDLNAAAAELGLTQMHFLNPTGLDESATLAGAYGSAYDVARLAANFYQTYPGYFELTTQATGTLAVADGALATAATAASLDSIPGFVAAKTGYTDLAGGNLVAVFDIDIGHPLIAVALGSTEDGRFSDIRTLIAAARLAQSTTIGSPSLP